MKKLRKWVNMFFDYHWVPDNFINDACIGIFITFVSVNQSKNMIKQNSLIYLVIVGFVFLSSCKSDWYNVPETAEPYVETFDNYAQQRGFDIDLEELGLIIEFSDLGEDTVARCNYEDPIRIELDEDIWTDSNGDHRESIIMRYMALGFLNRQNTNDVFPNGEWTSLMRGTPYDVDAKMCNTVNYFGFRKTYYIDELFDEKTKWPWWADHKTSYDSINDLEFNMVLEEDFLSNGNAWEQTSMILNGEVENGEFKVQNSSNSSENVLYNHDFDVHDNFRIECILKIENSASSDFSGLIWGASDHSAYYFTGYNMQNGIAMHNVKEDYGYFNLFAQNDNVDDFSNYNKISIVYLNKFVYVFMNQKFIYFTDIHGLYGDRFGFMVAANSTLIIDRLTIEHLK